MNSAMRSIERQERRSVRKRSSRRNARPKRITAERHGSPRRVPNDGVCRDRRGALRAGVPDVRVGSGESRCGYLTGLSVLDFGTRQPREALVTLPETPGATRTLVMYPLDGTPTLAHLVGESRRVLTPAVCNPFADVGERSAEQTVGMCLLGAIGHGTPRAGVRRRMEVRP